MLHKLFFSMIRTVFLEAVAVSCEVLDSSARERNGFEKLELLPWRMLGARIRTLKQVASSMTLKLSLIHI